MYVYIYIYEIIGKKLALLEKPNIGKWIVPRYK